MFRANINSFYQEPMNSGKKQHRAGSIDLPGVI